MPYHTWWFHAAVVSEDRWDTTISASLNARTRVPLALPEPTSLWEIERDEWAEDPDLETVSAAAAMAQDRVLPMAAPFIARMEARLARDRKRLNDYYAALLRETKQAKTRQRAASDPEKIEARKRAVQLELRRKLLELDERYAIRVSLRPIALVQTAVEVLQVKLLVHRKQACREHVLFWNPLLKAFEPFACSLCRRTTYSVAFTNQTVEPRCRDCANAEGIRADATSK